MEDGSGTPALGLGIVVGRLPDAASLCFPPHRPHSTPFRLVGVACQLFNEPQAHVWLAISLLGMIVTGAASNSVNLKVRPCLLLAGSTPAIVLDSLPHLCPGSQ